MDNTADDAGQVAVPFAFCESGMTPHERTVWLHLAYRSALNGGGAVEATQDELADELCMSPVTVQRKTEALTRMGWLHKESRRDGARRSPTRYVIRHVPRQTTSAA